MTRQTARLAALAVLAALAGCGNKRDAVDQDEIYRIAGKVVEGPASLGVPQARLRLKVGVPTVLGPRVFTAYGMTESDGTFELAVPVPFEAVRQATRIQIVAAKPGYAAKEVNVAPPEKQRQAYPVAPIALAKKPPAPLGETRPGP